MPGRAFGHAPWRSTRRWPEDGLYLIWSHEHNQWWGEQECGYVDTVRAAGRYTRTRVAEIVLDHLPAGEEVAVDQVSAMEHGRGAVWGLPDDVKKAGRS